MSLRESSGRICGEFAYIYPPGITAFSTGRADHRRNTGNITGLYRKDLPVQGLEDTDLFTIQVMASSGDMSI